MIQADLRDIPPDCNVCVLLRSWFKQQTKEKLQASWGNVYIAYLVILKNGYILGGIMVLRLCF